MSQPASEAIIYLLNNKNTEVRTSVEEGNEVAAHLRSGAEHAVEVKRRPDGARVVIRTAVIASVVFVVGEGPTRSIRVGSVGGFAPQ